MVICVQMALSKIHVALVGSSYLKHLEEDIQHNVYLDGEVDMLSDFGLEQITTHFVCGSGWLLADVKQQEENIMFCKPDIIVLQIGGNDLCRFGTLPESLADQLLEVASHLRIVTGAKSVIIGHITRRVIGRYITSLSEQSQFELARHKANKYLEVVSAEHESIKFWKHRGFEESQYDILAADGVHFNVVGQARFYKSLRGAILFALKHL